MEGDDNEIHITGDVSMAFRLYHRVTHNDTWLKDEAWPLVRDSADFFVSRAKRHSSTGNWTWLGVICPDEGAGIQDSNAYTNAIAAETMKFALATAERFGLEWSSRGNWSQISSSVYLPIVDYNGTMVHPEYENYTGAPINQADVALMQYPLQLPLDPSLAKNDLLYYQARSSGPSTAGFYTGDSAYSIAWLQLGNRSAADAQFDLAFEHMDLGHFNVWKEKSFGNFGNLNFITGAGGYLQNYLNGYAGVRYSDAGISLKPYLPPHGVTSLALRGLFLSGSRVHIEYTSDTLVATLLEGTSCQIGLRGSTMQVLREGQPVALSWATGDVIDLSKPAIH